MEIDTEECTIYVPTEHLFVTEIKECSYKYNLYISQRYELNDTS